MCLSPHTGIDCPDRLWKVLYWRCLGALWMSSCALEWTWWSREFRPAHSPSNLTHSVITEKIVLFIDKTALKKIILNILKQLNRFIFERYFYCGSNCLYTENKKCHFLFLCVQKNPEMHTLIIHKS